MIPDLFGRTWADTFVVSAVILAIIGLCRLWRALVELGRKRITRTTTIASPSGALFISALKVLDRVGPRAETSNAAGRSGTDREAVS